MKKEFLSGVFVAFMVLTFASCAGKEEKVCKTNGDCSSGDFCIAGNCESPQACSKDSDCENGDVCVNNICFPKEAGKCDSDPDCPQYYTCEDGKCLVQTEQNCISDKDCPSGQVCESGICVVDTMPPETTITSRPSNPSNSSSATFEFTCNEEDCTFECQLNNGGWSSCESPSIYTGLSDGDYEFEVRAADSAGNVDQTPASYSWTIDTISPDTAITSRPSNPSNSSSARFEFTCDEEGCTFECKLDDGSWESCTSPKDYANLQEGSHTFSVHAIDSAGNVDQSPANYSWTVDVPPETSITSHPSHPTNSTSAVFGFTCNEQSCTFACQLDSGPGEVCTSPKGYTGLLEGWHTFYVQAKDSSGNVDPTPDSYTWKIDLTPPTTTITSAPPNPSNSSSATFEFTCNESDCTFECKLDDGQYSPCSSPKIYENLSEQVHTFYVYAIDSAGNVDPLPEFWTWRVEIESWSPINTSSAPSGRRYHTAVWTSSEMIVWGGYYFDGNGYWLNTGGRYNASTNSWTPTSITNAPSVRDLHTAIWTGSEMIVWGGWNGSNYLNTGGRYNPSTDSWYTTSVTSAVPTGRDNHTAVWTGTQMIVWGGSDGSNYLNTGGRYDPSTDSWYPTSTTSAAPEKRALHTAVWTGSEMIVWGGQTYNGISYYYLNTGGRYDPSTDSWYPTSTTSAAPQARAFHTAVWTGSEMIVWGGLGDGSYLNTGARYNPLTNSWTPTSITNAPSVRDLHTAIWTGSEMIVWGGWNGSNYLNTGGRYDPSMDSWTPTSTTNAPSARMSHTAVWTSSEMIIWGGYAGGFNYFNDGGRFNP
jgi:Cys-rich repeat protein